MFDWDDLRIFVSASRAGTLQRAAERLAMDATTVGRRIARLERAIGATLFTRSPQGLQLTAAGARLLDSTQDVEAAIERARSTGDNDRVAGVVRMSVAEGFGTRVLAPALAELRRRRPSLQIELVASPGFLSPSKREVDLAVTLDAPTSNRLVVEPLIDYQLALFASDAYLARTGAPATPADLQRMDVVGYVEDLIYAPQLRYLDEVMPGSRPVLSSTSIVAQLALIASGGGVGVLPCFMAGGLTRVLPELMLTRRFWMSTHREVANAARVRAVRDWLKDLVKADRRLFQPYADRAWA